MLLPTVRTEKVESVPESPTAPTVPSTTTTARPRTTTTTTVELTPAAVETTTPRIYVSTSNFRPTLPNFGQENTEQPPLGQPEVTSAKSKSPISLIQQIPLVLAPRKPKQESLIPSTTTRPTTTTKSTTIVTTTSTSATSSTSKTKLNIHDLHNRLDELASNLDPWARIPHIKVHKIDINLIAMILFIHL